MNIHFSLIPLKNEECEENRKEDAERWWNTKGTPPLFGDREEMDNFYCTLSVTPNVVQITFYVVNLEKNTKSDHCSKFTSWCVTIITRMCGVASKNINFKCG